MKRMFFVLVIVLIHGNCLFSQSYEIRGQLSGWMTMNIEETDNSMVGLRYIPELSAEKTLSSRFTFAGELACNAYGITQFNGIDSPQNRNEIKPYRMWLRLSSPQFEARLGLQKISLGSASVIRPLMWFDRIDPRDPLQITDGVYGLLLRYYFLNNTNIWFWGLLGNDETKGWEFIPSDKNKLEYGGRLQVPVTGGEIGFTFNHRTMNLKNAVSIYLPEEFSTAPESRLGFDGKWDIGIGLWTEGTLTYKDIDLLPYRYTRLMNIGIDYTFGIGNGLTVLTEYFCLDASDKAFGTGENYSFSILMMSYPLGLLDSVRFMLYYDRVQKDFYRFIHFQRMYNRWSFHIMGFWNPEKFQIYRNIEGSSLFTGKGFQFMMVFNH